MTTDRELTTAELAEQYRLKGLAEHLEALANDAWAKANDIEARIDPFYADQAASYRKFANESRATSERFTSEYLRLLGVAIRDTGEGDYARTERLDHSERSTDDYPATPRAD